MRKRTREDRERKRASKKQEEKKIEQIKKEAVEEYKASQKIQKAHNKKVYQESVNYRTPEEEEHNTDTMEEINYALDGKFIYSKQRAKLYPKIYWVLTPSSVTEDTVSAPKAPVKEVIKEVFKEGNIHREYEYMKDPVPEQVVIGAFKNVLSEYNLDVYLDDYLTRKLFYHIMLSLAKYLYDNPEFYLELEDMHIYKEPYTNNLFTVSIPAMVRGLDKATAESLYNYYAGGQMDFEEMNRVFDEYAMSYLEYTDRNRGLFEKARDSYFRYKKLRETLKEAKDMLKMQGLPCTNQAVKEAVDKIRAERKQKQRERLKLDTNPRLIGSNLVRQRQAEQQQLLENEIKDLTNENICDIIDVESKDQTEK